MKKIVLLLLCLLIFMLCACSVSGEKVIVTTQSEVPSQSAAPSSTVIQESVSPSEAPAPGVSVSTVPDNTPEMYTSYAHMTAFSLADNTAAFDYFDMLRGDDAVQWLVDQEGYSLADAQALVNDYADSEFIEKNTNPQLRMVDLSAVPVTLIVSDDGSFIDGFEPRTVSIDTIRAMYTADPDLLLKPFFYEVVVSGGGQVEAVNQVYWP